MNKTLTIFMYYFSTIHFITQLATAKDISSLNFRPNNEAYQEKDFDKENLKRLLRPTFLKSPLGLLVTNGNQERIPTTLKDTINEGLDIPVTAAVELHKSSSIFWSNYEVSKSDTKLNKSLASLSYEDSNIDVTGIKELNLSAAKAWDLLVSCNNGNIEEARKRFYLADTTTICNTKQSTDVFKEIQNLALNFYEYLVNSMPLTKIENVPEGFILFKNPHPLLVEIAIMNWSLFFNHIYEPQFHKKISNKISNALMLYNNILQFLDLATSSPQTNLYEYQPQNMLPKDILITKVMVNTLLFLSKLNYDSTIQQDCRVYGLWPALNRITLYSFLITYYIDPLSKMRATIDSQVRNRCISDQLKAKYEQSDNYLTGIYSLYFNAIIDNIRLRSKVYNPSLNDLIFE